MMTVRVRVILAAIFVLALVWVIIQIRKRKLDLRYMLSWIALIIALLILILFPNILIILADFFGIYSPVNMIFFCGFAFSLVIIYSLTVAISKLSEEVKQLSQSNALIDYEAKEKQIMQKEFPSSDTISPEITDENTDEPA